ncbi:MAG: rhodanese-like domain-containing protein [Nitrosomonas sp.]|nr:rhodanese-like domain-containing protein [Nitrosomonas sp.]
MPIDIEGAHANIPRIEILFDEGYHLIDIREPDDFRIGHIPGAYHLSSKSDFDE